MKYPTLNARHVDAVLPSVLAAMRRRFPNIRYDMLLDAASAAMERCITSSFFQSDRSQGEVFRWLHTATALEVLREFRNARRYADFEANMAAIESITCGHRADSGAEGLMLWNWLVQRLGSILAETVWLHAIERCPPRDIAAIQQVSVSSIKARITRARKVVRQCSTTLT